MYTVLQYSSVFMLVGLVKWIGVNREITLMKSGCILRLIHGDDGSREKVFKFLLNIRYAQKGMVAMYSL